MNNFPLASSTKRRRNDLLDADASPNAAVAVAVAVTVVVADVVAITVVVAAVVAVTVVVAVYVVAATQICRRCPFCRLCIPNMPKWRRRGGRSRGKTVSTPTPPPREARNNDVKQQDDIFSANDGGCGCDQEERHAHLLGSAHAHITKLPLFGISRAMSNDSSRAGAARLSNSPPPPTWPWPCPA